MSSLTIICLFTALVNAGDESPTRHCLARNTASWNNLLRWPKAKRTESKIRTQKLN